MARPKGEISRLKLKQVHQLLPKNGSPISVKELKEKARKLNLGFDTLFNYLKRLEEDKIVLRSADLNSRPPKVYYKRITEDELDKELLAKTTKILDRIAPILRRIGEKIPLNQRKKFYLEWQLAYFMIFPAFVEARALEIPKERKEEFIETMMRIYFYPKLLNLANQKWLKPEDWINALKEEFPPKRVYKLNLKKVPKKFRPEVKRLLKELDKIEEEEKHADNP